MGCGASTPAPQAKADATPTAAPTTPAATAAAPPPYVLSLELKAEAERVFGLADTDGSGTVDLKELANLRNSPETAVSR